jgi:hypothetical protein
VSLSSLSLSSVLLSSVLLSSVSLSSVLFHQCRCHHFRHHCCCHQCCCHQDFVISVVVISVVVISSKKFWLVICCWCLWTRNKKFVAVLLNTELLIIPFFTLRLFSKIFNWWKCGNLSNTQYFHKGGSYMVVDPARIRRGRLIYGEEDSSTKGEIRLRRRKLVYGRVESSTEGG